MDFRKEFIIAIVTFSGITSAVDPDWSCDFQTDDCGIVKLNSGWKRNINHHDHRRNWFLQSDGGNSGSAAKFEIPYIFNSPRGNLTYVYRLRRNGQGLFSITTCRNKTDPAFTQTGIVQRTTITVPYTCMNKDEVEIVFSFQNNYTNRRATIISIALFETIFAPPGIPQRGQLPYVVISDTLAVALICCLIFIILLYQRHQRSARGPQSCAPRTISTGIRDVTEQPSSRSQPNQTSPVLNENDASENYTNLTSHDPPPLYTSISKDRSSEIYQELESTFEIEYNQYEVIPEQGQPCSSEQHSSTAHQVPNTEHQGPNTTEPSPFYENEGLPAKSRRVQHTYFCSN